MAEDRGSGERRQQTLGANEIAPNGTVVAWGHNRFGQTTVPAGHSGHTAVSAGTHFSLALVH
jgi:hypothetical protein